MVARSLCRRNSGSRPSITTELYGANNPSFKAHSSCYRLKKMIEKDPALKERQPYKAALENDKAYLKTEGMPAILELFSATHTGMTDDEFRAEVRAFMASAKHPKFGRGFGELTYQPMVELLAYLRSHGFKTYICSGGGIDFMRAISESLYGIPPEQVIGSSGKKVFAKGEEGWSMKRSGEISSFNDKEVKAVNIDLHIGRRPLLAGGNIRSHGDIGMCSYSQGRKGPSLQLLVNHDDDVREFSYAEEDGGSLKAAKANGWIVVSMKKDWNVVFSPEEDKMKFRQRAGGYRHPQTKTKSKPKPTTKQSMKTKYHTNNGPRHRAGRKCLGGTAQDENDH